MPERGAEVRGENADGLLVDAAGSEVDGGEGRAGGEGARELVQGASDAERDRAPRSPAAAAEARQPLLPEQDG
eukprot:3064368-Rhodomonas_salina.1